MSEPSPPPAEPRGAGAGEGKAGQGAGPVVLSPTVGYPELSDDELAVLADVGRHWDDVCVRREEWERALPVDPDLRGGHVALPGRFGRFTGVAFTAGAPDEVVATKRATRPETSAGRVLAGVRRAVIGPALNSSAVLEERMRKLVALAVLSSDALSSVAYGPEAMLTVLVVAGAGALSASLPIGAAIVVLMIAVGISYRQTIRAYPHGGGSYIVASDNLGRIPGLTAASGLMLDYILTVAVSVAAGVAAVESAIPSARGHPVLIGLVTIGVLLAGNLRGVRQSGAIFATPTYAFIAAILILTVVGLIDSAHHGFTPARPHGLAATESLGLLVVARAFASGATAMTGIEAISDGVPAFKRVEWKNARTTLTWMVSLLVVMFVGTMLLARLDGAVPNPNETVLSQLADRAFGHGAPLYEFVQFSTALVLLLAANTAFSDFPRLLFFLARDFHAPRIFLRMGDRLAFSNGILTLAIASALIYAGFGGQTEKLIPLFAVGVFLAFTLSQMGMVVHWWRRRDDSWKRSIVFNSVGAVLSAIVLAVTSITKFTEGAWLVIILIPLLVALFLAILRHYRRVHGALELHRLPPPVPRHGSGPAIAPQHGSTPARASIGRALDPGGVWGRARRKRASTGRAVEASESPEEVTHLIVVPVRSLDLSTMRTLAYGASLGQPLLAVHLSPNDEEAERFRGYWAAWGDHLPLQIVNSPFRALVVPIVRYVEALQEEQPGLTVTVLIPELIVAHIWQRPLHQAEGPRIRRALRLRPGVVVTTVPFHLPG